MAKLLISNRLTFHKKGDQKNFILSSKEILDVSWIEFGKKLNISPRTLTDWTREKFNMSEVTAKKISRLSKIEIPADHTVVNWNKHLLSISKKGGQINFAKNGFNKKKREDGWKTWWDETGQYKKPPLGFRAKIKVVEPKNNKKLAEFVGIMLGDGGIAKHHITITLSNLEVQYRQYIKKLLFDLFKVEPKIYPKKNAEAVEIVVHRTELVTFCKKIGLVQGSKTKQQVDIPEWIKNDKSFSIACIRGLIDTDGCFYNNSYYVKRKKYTYLKIAFTNSSKPLLQSIRKILENNGYRVHMNKSLKDIRIVDRKSVNMYIKNIGSSNSKHLQKV